MSTLALAIPIGCANPRATGARGTGDPSCRLYAQYTYPDGDADAHADGNTLTDGNTDADGDAATSSTLPTQYHTDSSGRSFLPASILHAASF